MRTAKQLANLRPIKKGQRTKEEAKKYGYKGGKKSGEVRRAKKTFKELAQLMLNMSAPDQVKKRIKEMFPDMTNDELTSKMAMLYVQYGKALKGDTRSFEVLRDTAGEKPVDKTELTGADGAPLVPPKITFTHEP